MSNLFRVYMIYERDLPNGDAHRDTALTDDGPLTRGALFYGQHGRAVVTKCVAVNPCVALNAPAADRRLVQDRPGFWRMV